jgi:dihydrodipicolinate synthase/N-acetylneuraminate lyase
MNHLVSFAAALCSVAYASKFDEGSATRDAMFIDGPMAAAFAPLGEDGELDFTNMPKMAARLNEWGVNRVLVGGTTGESLQLTREERTAVAKEWLRIAPEYNLDIYVNIQMESLKEAK